MTVGSASDCRTRLGFLSALEGGMFQPIDSLITHPLRRSNPPLRYTGVMRKFLLILLAVRAFGAQSSQEIRAAVDRAMPPVERSAAAFVAKRACVSCHHNFLPILMAE